MSSSTSWTAYPAETWNGFHLFMDLTSEPPEKPMPVSYYKTSESFKVSLTVRNDHETFPVSQDDEPIIFSSRNVVVRLDQVIEALDVIVDDVATDQRKHFHVILDEGMAYPIWTKGYIESPQNKRIGWIIKCASLVDAEAAICAILLVGARDKTMATSFLFLLEGFLRYYLPAEELVSDKAKAGSVLLQVGPKSQHLPGFRATDVELKLFKPLLRYTRDRDHRKVSLRDMLEVVCGSQKQIPFMEFLVDTYGSKQCCLFMRRTHDPVLPFREFRAFFEEAVSETFNKTVMQLYIDYNERVSDIGEFTIAPIDGVATKQDMAKWIKAFFVMHPRSLTLIVFTIIFDIMATIAQPLITQNLIDKYVPDENWEAIMVALSVYLIVNLVSTSTSYFVNTTAPMGPSDLLQMRHDYLVHVLRLPQAYLDYNDVPRMVNVLRDVQEVTSGLWAVVAQLNAFLRLAALMSLTFAIDVTMSLGILTVVVFFLGFSFYGGQKSARMKSEFQSAEQNVLVTFQEALALSDVSNGLGIHSVVSGQLQKECDVATTKADAFDAHVARMQFAGRMIEMTLFFFTLGMGAYFLFNDYITVGDFVAFVLAAGPLGPAVSQIYQLQHRVQQMRPALANVMDIENRKGDDRPFTSLPGKEGIELTQAKKASISISMDDVTFSYPPRTLRTPEPALQHISVNIPSGAKVGIVGPSGAGRSTLLKVMARMYSPSEGHVLWDGHVADEVPLCATVAFVSQTPLLYDTTIRENIRIGTDATDAQLRRACVLSILQEDLDRFPGGLDFRAGLEGKLLPASIRQRITIARGIVRQSPMLILDDPFSSQDAASITRLLTNFLKLSHTVLCSSSDPLLLKDFEYIAVLDGGRLVEFGKREDLLKMKGRFSRMIGDEDLAVDADGRVSMSLQRLKLAWPLFFWDDADVRSLADMFSSRSFSDGNVLLSLGHSIDCIYLIAKGEVVCEGMGSMNGHVYTAGDYILLHGLVDPDAKASVTYTCRGVCVLLGLQKQFLKLAVQQNHALQTHMEEITRARETAVASFGLMWPFVGMGKYMTSVTQATETLVMPRGTVICQHPTDPCTSLYMIVSGYVEVTYKVGPIDVTDDKHAGDYFGDGIFKSGSGGDATVRRAVAKDHTCLLVLPAAALERVKKSEQAIASLIQGNTARCRGFARPSHLSKCASFAAFSEDTLAVLGTAFAPRSIGEGHSLIGPGRPAACYVLVHGAVLCTWRRSDGSTFQHVVSEEGSVFGDHLLIFTESELADRQKEGGRWLQSVETTSYSLVLSCSRSAFAHVIHSCTDATIDAAVGSYLALRDMWTAHALASKLHGLFPSEEERAASSHLLEDHARAKVVQEGSSAVDAKDDTPTVNVLVLGSLRCSLFGRDEVLGPGDCFQTPGTGIKDVQEASHAVAEKDCILLSVPMAKGFEGLLQSARAHEASDFGDQEQRRRLQLEREALKKRLTELEVTLGYRRRKERGVAKWRATVRRLMFLKRLRFGSSETSSTWTAVLQALAARASAESADITKAEQAIGDSMAGTLEEEISKLSKRVEELEAVKSSRQEAEKETETKISQLQRTLGEFGMDNEGNRLSKTVLPDTNDVSVSAMNARAEIAEMFQRKIGQRRSKMMYLAEHINQSRHRLRIPSSKKLRLSHTPNREALFALVEINLVEILPEEKRFYDLMGDNNVRAMGVQLQTLNRLEEDLRALREYERRCLQRITAAREKRSRYLDELRKLNPAFTEDTLLSAGTSEELSCPIEKVDDLVRLERILNSDVEKLEEALGSSAAGAIAKLFTSAGQQAPTSSELLTDLKKSPSVESVRTVLAFMEVLRPLMQHIKKQPETPRGSKQDVEARRHIQSLRSEIRQLWDQCGFSVGERDREYTQIPGEKITQDRIRAHAAYLQGLRVMASVRSRYGDVIVPPPGTGSTSTQFVPPADGVAVFDKISAILEEAQIRPHEWYFSLNKKRKEEIDVEEIWSYLASRGLRPTESERLCVHHSMFAEVNPRQLLHPPSGVTYRRFRYLVNRLTRIGGSSEEPTSPPPPPMPTVSSPKLRRLSASSSRSSPNLSPRGPSGGSGSGSGGGSGSGSHRRLLKRARATSATSLRDIDVS